MIDTPFPRALLVTAALVAAIPAAAAGPFRIHRATSPGALAAAPPAATVSAAPFDDLPALYADGVSYYYGVYDAAGVALDVSAVRNPATGSIRIGFDDGNPASAPVHPSLSTVSVSASSIRADGLQTTTITIVPKDANGVALGRGLAIAIDGAMLWPLGVAGPGTDLGDGTYRIAVRATTPGVGTAWISVEGIVLASRPTIAATAVSGTSPRDLAISEIASLGAPSGPIASLVTQAGAGTTQANAVEAALANAQALAWTLANGDWKRDDNVLKSDLDGLLGQLAGVLANPGTVNPAGIRQVMEGLVDAARQVALAHVDAAVGTCGACGSDGLPRRVCDANAALASTDVLRDASSPDWSTIADGYARVVELGLQAEQHC